MSSFNSQSVLIVATILFVLGLIGVLTRKNIIFILCLLISAAKSHCEFQETFT